VKREAITYIGLNEFKVSIDNDNVYLSIFDGYGPWPGETVIVSKLNKHHIRKLRKLIDTAEDFLDGIID